MREVLHVISGKRLPVVFHVGARALTSQALNIHAGHDDVMAVADTGWDDLMAAVKGPLTKHVGKRGDAVVDANLALIRAAYQELRDVTAPLRDQPVGSAPSRTTVEVAA